MDQEVQKPFYKKWWLWVTIPVFIVIIVFSIGGSYNLAANDSATNNQQTVNVEAMTETTHKETISKTEFERIANGMTYDAVKSIIGSEGEVVSEVGEKGSYYHTIIYQWRGDASMGANANLIFQGGKLQGKTQFES